MSNLEKFVEVMEYAILNNKGIRVLITMPDLPKPEMIVNPASNVKAKLKYYKKAYNDNLELKSYPAITIGHYETI